jgi:hypothetical protein
MSQIQKINKNGVSYLAKNYILNGEEVIVKAPIMESKNDAVFTECFPSNNLMRTGMDAKDFFDEIAFLISQMEGKESNIQSAWDAFFELCGSHINECGRLIDNDLESYLDRILLLLVSISTAFRIQPITENQGKDLRNDFKKAAFKVFQNYIYLTQIKSPLGGYNLIKLTEYNENN